MRPYRMITNVSTILAATALPALAETEGRGSPSQGAMWIFLGICALIITAQVVPLIKNLKSQSKMVKQQTKAAEGPHAQ